ncbi:MAG: hypothetical protein ACD_72C00123G0004 [uncultured bacterium]|nr:MAG: hypothetical protein ACD_72C00123G0004 [uncultured bacterium]
MKNKWLNLVLLLTNQIYQKKQLVIGQTGLGAVGNIFTLILLETVLAIISLPLYISLRTGSVTAFFAEKGSYAKVNFDYNLRRVITLTGVIIIALIWATKLALIVALPKVYGPLPLYAVTDFRPADILSKDLVATETGIQTARIMKSMFKPQITGVNKLKGGNYTFLGIGQPNSTVILLLTDKQTAIYSGQTDKNGQWQIDYLASKFKLSAGNHSVIVFGYDAKLGVRSETGLEQFFKVQTSWLESFTSNVDVLANWSVVIIILLGVFLTFLTL